MFSQSWYSISWKFTWTSKWFTIFSLKNEELKSLKKLVANFYDKTEYVIRIRNLKEALNHGLILKQVLKVIKFNQNAWLKPYIDMNTDLRKKAKNDFEKDFFKLMNNAVFGKTMENVRKHRDIKLVTTERRRNYLVSEPNYHTTTFFTEHIYQQYKWAKQNYLWINLCI